MPDLRTLVTELRDEYAERGKSHTRWVLSSVFVERLTAILEATEPGEWRGPWKCEKCGMVWGPIDSTDGKCICFGTLRPHERRQA